MKPSVCIPMRTGKVFGVVVIGALLLLSLATKATVLTFDGIGTSSATPIPLDYGDRVSTTMDFGTGYQYGFGNGLTPDVAISYVPSSGNFSLWVQGYAELTNAFGHIDFNVPGEIVFTPDPGYRVRLNSFDIAGWTGVDYQTTFAIYDNYGSQASPNLFSADLLVPGANSISPLSHSLLADGPLHIYIDNIGSTGLDNINFDQVSGVPLPAAGWLFGSGLLAIVRLTRQKLRTSESSR